MISPSWGVEGHSFPGARQCRTSLGSRIPIEAAFIKSSSVIREGTQLQATNYLAIVSDKGVLKNTIQDPVFLQIY